MTESYTAPHADPNDPYPWFWTLQGDTPYVSSSTKVTGLVAAQLDFVWGFVLATPPAVPGEPPTGSRRPRGTAQGRPAGAGASGGSMTPPELLKDSAAGLS